MDIINVTEIKMQDKSINTDKKYTKKAKNKIYKIKQSMALNLSNFIH